MKIKAIHFAALTLLALIGLNYTTPRHPNHKTYLYHNGYWFNGEQFIQKNMYVKEGVFISATGVKADSVIDLNGMYIVPPFAEAHTHILEGIGDVDARIKSYLRDGVFYVKNPNNVVEWTKTIYTKINIPSSLDASFANAGITGPGGHPESIYEDRVRLHMKDMGREVERGWFKNKAYYIVDSQKELDATWPEILKGKPDFIKIYLSNSENHAEKNSLSKKLRTGLHPAIAALIVAKAHSAGLRVTAHVESAADFRQAAAMKVDEINHTPGFYIMLKDSVQKYMLTDADAKLAARNKVYVVTALLSRDLLDDASLLPLAKEVQRSNLSLLYKNGVKLAIGSDHAMSPVQEVNALRELEVFDNKTLLKLWCESTPVTIFPKRKLGLLKEGYEANFLALSGDPLNDWKQTGEIKLRVKKGQMLQVN
jgi:imidazolonepropionase-like amidohydrolase